MSFGIPISQIVQENANGLLAAHPSWSRVPLGEISQVLNGFAFPSKNFSKDKGKPLLRIRDILQDQTAVLYDGQYDTTYLVYPSDLVIGMDGDFNCTLWKGPEALLNQRVCKVIPNELFYSHKFLLYVLPGYLQAINTKTSSQTVKHLSSKTVADIPLPLPPLTEQHHIVTKIEELFTRLDAGVEALKKMQTQLRRYRQAVLKHAFEGKLTEEWRQLHKHELEAASALLERIKQERHKTTKGKYRELSPLDTSNLPQLPEGWVLTWIGEVSLLVTKGSTPTSYGFNYTSSGINFIKVENLNGGRVNRSSLSDFITKDTYEFLERSQLSENDVLFSIAGTIGRTAITQHEDLPANINQAIALIRCPWQFIKPKYLENVLSSSIARLSIGKQPRGIGMNNVSLGDVNNIVFPLPPLSEQERIVSEIKHHFSISDQIEKTIDHSLKQAERLRQSILKRAFEGKLVPHDSNDEPAEKLLERIKAESQASGRSQRYEQRKKIHPQNRRG